MASIKTPRFAWALTGSGHYFTECLQLMARIPDLDLFVTRAGDEVVRMYRKSLAGLPRSTRLDTDEACRRR